MSRLTDAIAAHRHEGTTMQTATLVAHEETP